MKYYFILEDLYDVQISFFNFSLLKFLIKYFEKFDSKGSSQLQRITLFSNCFE